MKYKKISIIADNTKIAQDRLEQINTKYNFLNLESKIIDIDLIIVLGGDGFMLHCLHSYLHLNIPIYGINCGTVGFLLNHFELDGLMKRLEKSIETVTHPLEMEARLIDGSSQSYCAINEISLFRKSSQAARIKISVNDEVRLPELVSDGVLLSTPAGSSAYNASVNGPILPIGSDILALTPISPFRPKKWGGALLPHTAIVTFTILDPEFRPVNAVADFFEVSNVASVVVKERRDISIRLLFDENHSLEERILKEQFA
jgi:NAD+ kinase